MYAPRIASVGARLFASDIELGGPVQPVFGASVTVAGDDGQERFLGRLGAGIGHQAFPAAFAPEPAFADPAKTGGSVEHIGAIHPDNAGQVLAQLELATELCRTQECHAMVTAPVHKGIINAAGIPFSGHTEFLANQTGADAPVMLLTAGALKVALATTHLPLRAVPDAITAHSLEQSLRVLASGLKSSFGIAQPRITVLGLNPHAGENGHMGNEEQEVIGPVCDLLRAEGLSIKGPISADTAFSAAQRATTDAYLAMFHDQGLPVIKSEGFGEIVNVTLGLPVIRTSVDHGTALSLAGTGQADSGSMKQAIALAIHMTSATLG
ncbi:MAG: 4-hydroxythreonine-4-phosphate dehydrogenase PdxA [Rhodobacteraceae bacterium]|nr:4-hydroxythreonine-4-phosphate dehydrogenase PdxA [Paracoccaceae bacterium]